MAMRSRRVKKAARPASYARTSGFVAARIPGSNDYVLVARGVFSESTVMRRANGAHATPPLDAQQKQFIREAMDRFLKPYAKA
jgi:hypothetical protein